MALNLKDCSVYKMVCAVLSRFSSVWLFDLMDCRPPGSSVHGILQARILEWVVMSSSRGSSQSRDWTWVSYVSWLAGWLYTTSATWEVQYKMVIMQDIGIIVLCVQQMLVFRIILKLIFFHFYTFHIFNCNLSVLISL